MSDKEMREGGEGRKKKTGIGGENQSEKGTTGERRGGKEDGEKTLRKE